MAVRLGIFVVPDATNADATVDQILTADSAGLDVVGVQDHPYQWRFFDTWTLLAYAAARTARVTLLPDVANLPLRPPAPLAKAAASLDLLSGGRLELGLGAGAFWSGERSISFDGTHYSVRGAHPGPAPAHPIGIWIGAYGPRMLRLTGRLGDGWLPSIGGRRLNTEDALRMQGVVDEAARAAGRDPAAIERAANVMALEGDPRGWPDQLARIVDELRFTTLIAPVPGDDPIGFVERLGEDVAPRLRELLH